MIMKKIFTLLLALAASVGTMVAWDYERVQLGHLCYNLDAENQTAEVTSKSEGTYKGAIAIPATVEYGDLTYRVTSIGANAFFWCGDLTSVSFGSNVTSIGYQAFYNCANLTSIDIPNSVTSIGDFAFIYDNSINTVTIGSGLSYIGVDAFSQCHGLTSYNVSADNQNYSSLDGVLLNKDQTTILLYPCGKEGDYVVPNSVTFISKEAFDMCWELTGITISENVADIKGGFSGCTGLKSVVWNAKNCYSGRFNTPNYIESFIFGEKVEYIPSCCYGLSGLTSIVIPNSVTSIASWAFWSCSGLTSVTIGDNVTSIGESAFAGCSGITSLTLPSSLSYIGQFAFNDCSGIASITCKAVNPPTSWGNCFYSIDKSIPLYVPEESVEAYSKAEGWNEFTNIIGIEPEDPNSTTIDLTTATEIAYTDCSATPSVEDGVLTVNYSAGGWQWAGVEFDLEDYIEITNICFDYKGDGQNIVIYPYLRDSQGARWRKGDYYLNLSNTEWQTETAYLPDALLWDAADYACGEKPFVKLGFVANPGTATTGSFCLRNIKVTGKKNNPTTGLYDTNAATAPQKLLINGQIIIIRGDKTYTVTGQEAK